MNNNNQENATRIALNESAAGNSSKVKKSSGYDNTAARNLTTMELWSIRRNARTFKIHNRIPRL